MTAYHPHHGYSAAARLTPDLPRLALGFVLIEVGYKLGLNLLDAVLVSAPDGFVDSYYNGTTRSGLLLQLFAFSLLILSVITVTRKLHFRSAVSLIGPPSQAWNDLRQVTLACLGGFLLIELLPPYYSYAGGVWNMPLAWLTTLPLAMIALLIQTGAEELLYRGYLQQQLAARFRAAWVWMLVPNLLFAAAHWQPHAASNEAWEYVAWAFFFGLAASDLTARSGTLGAAVGFHLANNAFAFLFFGEMGSTDSGLALMLFPAPEATGDSLLPPSAQEAVFPSAQLITELLAMLIIWLSARIAIRR